MKFYEESMSQSGWSYIMYMYMFIAILISMHRLVAITCTFSILCPLYLLKGAASDASVSPPSQHQARDEERSDCYIGVVKRFLPSGVRTVSCYILLKQRSSSPVCADRDFLNACVSHVRTLLVSVTQARNVILYLPTACCFS